MLGSNDANLNRCLYKETKELPGTGFCKPTIKLGNADSVQLQQEELCYVI